jgi:protein-S-isoprenylcysteine O-methyltransferase Ste14
MKLKVLVGSGDRIMSLTLPFIVIGIAANILWPRVFTLGFGLGGLIAGIVLLVVGVPVWLSSVALVLINVPRKRLITTGPFAVTLHPMYTVVAVLVLPGVSLILDTWVGAGIGVILYGASRIYSPREDEILKKFFPTEYLAYRRRVLLPWL